MLIKLVNILVGICCSLMLGVADASAFVPPKGKAVHIELVYDVEGRTTAMGETRYFDVVPYTYFRLNDIYSDVEHKVGSESYGERSTALDFEINHPLYDELIPNNQCRIPFYVEPGDSLIIYITKTGCVQKYGMKNGKEVKCEKMLLHDISNSEFYTAHDFEADRKDTDFPQFVQRVMKKMHVVVDSVNRVADKWGFTDKERSIAVNNAKLQFAIWLFEFAPYKQGQLSEYSRTHKSGWQMMPNQESDLLAISSEKNYAFLNELPLTDSTCLASKYFPQFIQSYEHAHIFNSDQYLYYGTTKNDIARMDSAFVAKERRITGRMMPSLFMDIAMERRHYEPLPDDGSIHLKEVQVMGRRSDGYFPGITAQDMLNAKLNSRPVYNALSPSYWLYDRKREKRKARARAFIKKLEEEEQREQEERDAIIKAYEEEKNR